MLTLTVGLGEIFKDAAGWIKSCHRLDATHRLVLICPIYEILTDTTTSGQNGPGSNGNEGILSTPHNESHHQMQFDVTHRTPHFVFGGGGREGLTSL